ncbi:hypothetical protein RRG08_019268 [Elysia crispata]|uniref:Uncharacterized protein n=1 Tax=Elysia crispata TaxID=231223 RepID=A0AAE0YUK9_9GAST|nr:hypothetical protein RRG08_019268 [Elysia crispata]
MIRSSTHSGSVVCMVRFRTGDLVLGAPTRARRRLCIVSWLWKAVIKDVRGVQSELLSMAQNWSLLSAIHSLENSLNTYIFTAVWSKVK